ncbi:MAG TPA: 30S ribosomal protein S5 [Candidatus Babeliales bacterium]|jgi:small subunit ribosomal protein S5|nr:30S ribosomal protein S5 [Candidatus Babeliales bacterium]
MAIEREKNIKEKESPFVDHVVQVRRVTKVTKGGKRFSFAAFVVTGDRVGNVGVGSGKGREASQAITKATNKARKSLISIPRRDRTIPYSVQGRHGASRVIVHPASKGTGNIAGGAARSICNAAGIEDVLIKSLGSSNGTNVAKATLNAFAKLRTAEHIAKLRGKTVKQVIKEA